MPLSDDWRPAASLSTLKLRAQVLARIRGFFARRGVLEVETPVLAAAAATDPNLHSFSARSPAPESGRYYLHTSPEFAMKRLVAAGSGSIYQVARVFRAGEAGRWHNPEFTLLEWYRVGFDYHRLMDDVAALVADAVDRSRPLQTPEKISYRDAFRRYAGVDAHAAAAELAAAARAHRVELTDGACSDGDSDFWRDLLLTHVVEPHLGRGRPTFLYDYPASQAALARVRPGDPPVAERFELYLDGVELANGFQELTDPAEQRARFARDRAVRSARGLEDIPHDERLLAALAHGLPECSGVALGVDRLVAAAAGARSLRETLAFPIDAA